jgi:TRAP-type C4-dicarboxylate transport system substrate-binding protein
MDMKEIGAALLLGAALATGNGAVAGEYDDVTLRYASFLPENYYQSQADKQFIEQVGKGSGGAIRIQPFWQASLGKDTEMLALVSSGAVDFGNVVTGYFPSELPFAAVTNALPMVFFDGKAVVAATADLYEKNPTIKAELDKNNLTPILMRYLPNYRIICTTPIRTMQDLKGKKIQTYGAFVPVVMESIGAVPVSAPLPETYESLQRGVLDCGYLHQGGMEFRKWHEVARYLIDIDFGAINAYVVFMNKQRFDSLNEASRALIKTAGAEATAKAIADMTAEDAKGRAAMIAAGVTVVEFQETEALRAAVPDMLGVWTKRMSEAGKGAEAESIAQTLHGLTQ